MTNLSASARETILALTRQSGRRFNIEFGALLSFFGSAGVFIGGLIYRNCGWPAKTTLYRKC